MAIKLPRRIKPSSTFDSFAHKTSKANESKIITAKALVDSDTPDFEWIAEGILANGLVSLLSAHPKVGKTTFLYHFLKALLDEPEFIQRALNFEGDILLLSEEPRQILKAKFKDLGLDTERLHILERFQVQDWSESIELIEKTLQKGKIKLVIVDTLAAFWNVKDENSAAGITAPYQLFQHLIQRYSVAGMLIHHLRKRSGSEIGESVRGSSAILAAVDVTMEMGRKNDTERNISIQSRYSPVATEEIVVGLVKGKFEYLGAKSEFSTEKVQERLIELIKSNSGKKFRAEEIRERINPKPGLSTTKKSLEKLFIQGALSRAGKGSKGDPWLYSFSSSSIQNKPHKIAQKHA